MKIFYGSRATGKTHNLFKSIFENLDKKDLSKIVLYSQNAHTSQISFSQFCEKEKQAFSSNRISFKSFSELGQLNLKREDETYIFIDDLEIFLSSLFNTKIGHVSMYGKGVHHSMLPHQVLGFLSDLLYKKQDVNDYNIFTKDLFHCLMFLADSNNSKFVSEHPYFVTPEAIKKYYSVLPLSKILFDSLSYNFNILKSGNVSKNDLTIDYAVYSSPETEQKINPELHKELHEHFKTLLDESISLKDKEINELTSQNNLLKQDIENLKKDLNELSSNNSFYIDKLILELKEADSSKNANFYSDISILTSNLSKAYKQIEALTKQVMQLKDNNAYLKEENSVLAKK